LIQVSANYSNPDKNEFIDDEVSMPVSWGHRQPEQTRARICIVDDDEAVADSLRTLLETFGFEVQSYGSGADFLDDDRVTKAGCLVIDQQMPGMSGLDVVERLRREGIRLPIILISGRLDTTTKERAASLGVTKIVDKPFAARRLVNLIQATLSEPN
jgi:two-component system, LuxR family, response regulator FixJ